MLHVLHLENATDLSEEICPTAISNQHALMWKASHNKVLKVQVLEEANGVWLTTRLAQAS